VFVLQLSFSRLLYLLSAATSSFFPNNAMGIMIFFKCFLLVAIDDIAAVAS
jgi:hypothetical protein